jgi:hypothetical protein
MPADFVQFADLIEIINRLPLERRENLVEIIHLRNIKEQRNHFAAIIRSARRGNRLGKCKFMSNDELIQEILD